MSARFVVICALRGFGKFGRCFQSPRAFLLPTCLAIYVLRAFGNFGLCFQSPRAFRRRLLVVMYVLRVFVKFGLCFRGPHAFLRRPDPSFTLKEALGTILRPKQHFKNMGMLEFIFSNYISQKISFLRIASKAFLFFFNFLPITLLYS